MSARRFVVITRLVRAALGKTNRASSPGRPACEHVAVELERSLDLRLVALAQRRIALGDGVGEHRRLALELHVALALLVERDAGPVAHELVRERPRDAGDGEREDDVLDRRPVAGFDHRRDELLHLDRVEVAGQGASEDLLGGLFRIARPARGVDDRDVRALDDLAVREQERHLHAEVAPARVLGDPGLVAGRFGGTCRGRGRDRIRSGGLSGHRGASLAATADPCRWRGPDRPDSCVPHRVDSSWDAGTASTLEGIGHDLVEAHRRPLRGQRSRVRRATGHRAGSGSGTGRSSGRRSRPCPSRSSAAGGGPRPTAGRRVPGRPSATATIARSSRVRVTPGHVAGLVEVAHGVATLFAGLVEVALPGRRQRQHVERPGLHRPVARRTVELERRAGTTAPPGPPRR